MIWKYFNSTAYKTHSKQQHNTFSHICISNEMFCHILFFKKCISLMNLDSCIIFCSIICLLNLSTFKWLCYKHKFQEVIHYPHHTCYSCCWISRQCYSAVYIDGCISPAKANTGLCDVHPQRDHYLTWAAATGVRVGVPKFSIIILFVQYRYQVRLSVHLLSHVAAYTKSRKMILCREKKKKNPLLREHMILLSISTSEGKTIDVYFIYFPISKVLNL